MPIHLLFDLDGTLIDSSAGILASMSATLVKCGIVPIVSPGKSLTGPPLRDTLQPLTCIDDSAQIDSLVNAFKADYDTDGYREAMAYPGIHTALISLQAAGNRLLIITNKRIAPTKSIISYLGWDTLFFGVFALDSFTLPGSIR